jgi:hypothetical protein
VIKLSQFAQRSVAISVPGAVNLSVRRAQAPGSLEVSKITDKSISAPVYPKDSDQAQALFYPSRMGYILVAKKRTIKWTTGVLLRLYSDVFIKGENGK